MDKNYTLSINSITFGKYKGGTLQNMLKDRKYCNWLTGEEWFQKNYEYLYNQVLNYNPRDYFLPKNYTSNDNFLESYIYFNLNPVDILEIDLNYTEKICYEHYLKMIQSLKQKIITRINDLKENIFDIKAPTKWLKNFEQESGIPRDDFKNFINSYDLPNLTYIIEDIKKQGGIEYKGAKSFIIAKENSKKQEEYWEQILKEKYNEDISIQYKYKNCIFDFININSNTLYEAKISIKDYNDTQYKKYLVALEKYNIIYLIGMDCIIDISKKIIYTTNSTDYIIYLCNIPLISKPTKLDEIILEFSIIQVESLEQVI